MAIEGPRQLRIFPEPSRVGHFLERDAQLGYDRVGSPEPLGAPKIGQARVNTHARACGDQQGIGGVNGFRRQFDFGIRGRLHRNAFRVSNQTSNAGLVIKPTGPWLVGF